MDELMHYGTPRHSGRYPWGSGENPYQHDSGFRQSVQEMRANGMTDTEIAEALHMSTWEFRKKVSVSKSEEIYQNKQRVQKLKDKGYSPAEIARITGIPDSTVRSYIRDIESGREDRTKAVTDLLRSQVDEKGMLDVGLGVEKSIGEDGIPKTRMANALAQLEAEGYELHEIRVEQATNPGKYTTVQVLCKPGTTWQDVNNNPDQIKQLTNYTIDDNGREYTNRGIAYPTSIDPSRVQVAYAEDGGKEKDGLIELRRGVDDISMGNASYAQVRIAVDGTHYIKGMAIYSDDLPPGVDIRFNTNKHEGTPMLGPKDNTVFKPMSNDPDNPFGSTIKENGQHWYIDKNGNEQLGVVNKVREEGEWNTWEKSLPSQFLSKQNLSLINKQLDLSYSDKKKEFEEINSLTNNAVKKTFLDSFADDCDAAAVNLKAAALPNQTSKVILPISSMKNNEIYCPTLENGQQVVLIRYPHGGIFEIPELVVNNKQADAKKALGNAIDAVGINSKVAEQLSGADFDGDTVTVIPVNSKVKISTSAPLKALKNFDAKEQYAAYPGMPKVAKEDSFDTQLEMGKISNLITDMTIKGATPSELARAVKHSMVIIDAEKHNLNYKQSYIDNDIDELKSLYQAKENGKKPGGASTIISKAKSPVYVDERKEITPDKETGEKQYLVKEPKVRADGTISKPRKQESTQMAETKDAYSLVSKFNSPKERAYAEYANQLKALANSARKESLSIKAPKRNEAAEKIYSAEVSSLNAKLNNALKNAPRERQAQLITKARVKAKTDANPELKEKDHKSELTKLKAQTLARARIETGASKKNVLISITPKEWEAIQAGAVSYSKCLAIFQNTDQDTLRQLASPKPSTTVSSSTKALIRSMNNSGYTLKEIADRTGLSTSTVAEYTK